MLFPLRADRKAIARACAFAVLAVASLARPGIDPVAMAQQAGPDGSSGPTEPAKPPEGSVGGMGDINLYPKRVVIDQRQRIATVGLYNRTAESGDYKIDIRDMMMTPEGRLVDLNSVTDPAQKARVRTASAMLRWSPRRVELKGNEAQTVRIMARIPPDTPAGEYRSHFSAIAIPPVGEGGLSIENAAGEGAPNSIGVRIMPRFGISIPVIVRVGETTLNVRMSDIQLGLLPDGRKAIQLTLSREGTRSAFGDIAVKAAGESKPVALIKGIGVYPEIDSRTVTIPVNPETDPRLIASGTRLTLTYTDDDFDPGSVLARQEYVVP